MADNGTRIGTVTHYYDKIGVGIIKLDQELTKGQTVNFKGKKTDFTQTVNQIQFDHQDIESGAVGHEVGIKVDQPVHDGDGVFIS